MSYVSPREVFVEDSPNQLSNQMSLPYRSSPNTFKYRGNPLQTFKNSSTRDSNPGSGYGLLKAWA
jgi:hypothetical protein